MFGINGWELPVLAIVALLVLGPDKLPKYAADAARFLRQVRRMATDARDEVTRDLGPEFRDIDLADLNPRTFVSRHLLQGEDLSFDDEPERRPARRVDRSAPAPRRSSASPRPQLPAAGGDAQRTPYDDDAT